MFNVTLNITYVGQPRVNSYTITSLLSEFFSFQPEPICFVALARFLLTWRPSNPLLDSNLHRPLILLRNPLLMPFLLVLRQLPNRFRLLPMHQVISPLQGCTRVYPQSPSPMHIWVALQILFLVLDR